MVRAALPGLVACVAIAALARVLGDVAGVGIETALALLIAIAVGTVGSLRASLGPGAALAARTALRLGITLLGARLTLDQVVATGGASVAAIVVVVLAALGLGALVARRLEVAPPLSWLVSVGMAICGNSAILALSPIVRAPHRDTVYAVSTITIFGLAGVILLPAVGLAMGASDVMLGTWAGLSVNDTAQVVAAGYAYSGPAGDIATVVKLTRNVAILPVLVGAAWLMSRRDGEDRPSGGIGRVAWLSRAVPWFVIGFVVMAGLRTAGALDVAIAGVTLADVLVALAGALILVALAGVGLGTDVRGLAAVGARPFLQGVLLWLAILALGFLLASAIAGTAVAGTAPAGTAPAGTAPAGTAPAG